MANVIETDASRNIEVLRSCVNMELRLGFVSEQQKQRQKGHRYKETMGWQPHERALIRNLAENGGCSIRPVC